MTTGYNAGIDSSDMIFSYGEESVWGVLPNLQFQSVRLLSESLAESKTRSRPAEIEALGYAAHGITTQVQVAGDVAFALSYLTHDKLFQGLLNGTYSTALTHAASGTNTTIAGGGRTITSAASSFTNTAVGQWVKTAGWSNPGNNGWFRLSARSGTVLTMMVGSTTMVNETSASASQTARGEMLRNGVVFNSFYLQKRLATSLFLNYAGGYISSGSFKFAVGEFAQGSFSFMAKSETLNAVSQSNPVGELAAPTNLVMDTVAGFQNFIMATNAARDNDAAVAGTLQSIEINVTKNNARAQYGIGSASAAGMGRGTLQVDGTMSIYFTSNTLYNLYKNETDVLISFRVQDTTGNAYVFTIPKITLINPQIVAGGPDTDMLAQFSFEAAQDSTTGCTIQIDRCAV